MIAAGMSALYSMGWWVGAKAFSQVSLNLGDEFLISLRELDQTATMHVGCGVTCVFESGYLMATALTSLNVVWPSRTFCTPSCMSEVIPSSRAVRSISSVLAFV